MKFITHMLRRILFSGPPRKSLHTGVGLILSLVVLMIFFGNPVSADDQSAVNYGETPAEYVPYNQFKEPYVKYFQKVNEYNGYGRNIPEPETVASVKIGFLGPIEKTVSVATGGVSHEERLGKKMLQGAALAILQKNQANGYRNSGIPYELVIRNDNGLWGASGNEIIDLAYREKVWAILGTIDGANSHIAIRVALKAEIPVMNSGDTDPTYTETSIPWAFRCITDDRQMSYLLADFVFKTLKLKRVAVLRANNRYGRIGIDEFRDAATRSGYPLIAELNYKVGDTDFSGQIETLKSLNPDAVVTMGNADESALILNQMRAMGLNSWFLGSDRIVSDAFIQKVDGDLNRVAAASPYNPDSTDPLYQKFRDSFIDHYNEAPESFAAHAYDGMNMLLEAIETGGLNRANIRDRLSGMTTYHGVTGIKRFDPVFNNLTAPFLALGKDRSFQFISRDSDLNETPYRSMENDPIGFEGYTKKISEDSARQPVTPITIGLFIPERADDPVAESILKGAEMAVMNANREGGYNGRLFQLIRRWATDPWAAGSKEMIGFVYEDQAVAVISFMAASSHIAQQVAVKTYIPVLTPVSSDASLTHARVPWMFRLPPDDRMQASALINRYLKPSGCDSVGMITSLASDCRTAAGEIRKALAAHGYSPLFHHQITPETTQYDDLAEYVKSFSPDAVVIKVGRSQLTDILYAFKKHGLKCPVLIPWTPGVDSETIEKTCLSAAVLVEPLQMSDVITGDSGFYRQFMQVHKHAPDISAVYAYDAVRMITRAVQLTGTDRADIRNRISEMSEYRGAGGVIAWDTGGGNRREPGIRSLPNCLTPEDITANNRGVALMGRFDFEAAFSVFKTLSDRYPDDAVIRMNLAISMLNRQGPEDERQALELLNTVLAEDENNIYARYCSGLLELHMGRMETALGHFLTVLKTAPNDPEVLYFAGKTLAQMSRYEEALDYFHQALAIDEYISSAYYSIIMVFRQLGKKDEALSMIKTYQKLKNNPRARVLDFKYTKMGTKAEAVAINLPDPHPVQDPSGPVFDPPATVEIAGPDNIGPPNQMDFANSGMTATDINRDGFPDLFVPRAFNGENGLYNAVLYGTTDLQKFELDKTHPFSAIENINTALWGDINNDGNTDVYFCRKGPSQLWLQDKDNAWENHTKISLTAGTDADTLDGALFDADHDSDLDIFLVNGDAPNELLNNNGDTTFRPLAADYGLTGKNPASRSILLKDLDNDRDADIIILNETPPHEVYINQRLWRYDPGKGWDHFIAADIRAAVSGDINHDGRCEIYTLDADYHLFVWEPDENGKWRQKLIFKEPLQNTEGRKRSAYRLSLSDYDGDGVIELFKTFALGWKIISPGNATPDTLFSFQSGSDRDAAGSIVQISTPNGPAIVGMTSGTISGGQLSCWPPGPGRFLFCNVELSGRQAPDNSIRTNASGIGATLTIRNGSQWTILDTFRNHSGPGQGYQPVTIGMRQSEKLDFIKVEWPDGVFQTEMDLVHQNTHTITETQRQMSSCPVLFAWDGKKFEFVSDILGVGGIGYAVGPGEYAEPRPWENFMMPEVLLKPRHDRLMIKLTEPMEETEYLDAVMLKAYDLPQGWAMTLDERMGISAPFPTGAPVFFKTTMLPETVVNDRGQNVTADILKNDLAACPPGPVDHRFIGRLENNHVLTLSFPEPIKAGKPDPVLLIDGWVEYPYSQTSFAAWQAKAAFLAPSIEFKTAGGEWKMLLDQFGYPAGMPRQMSVPLQGLPPGVDAIRITTNQEIYWDRIMIAYPEICADVEVHELAFKTAVLEEIGFPQRIDFAQRRPYYDFSNRRPVWDTRLQTGFYTSPGDVLELVGQKDNALAIMGPGESIHMEFEAPPVPCKAGWQRIYVLETHGWCKDMDLYTRTGETVAPVPYLGEYGETAKQLNDRYNARYLSGGL